MANPPPNSETPPPYPKPAGGWGALWSSFHHIRKEQHLLYSIKALLNVNQPDGFDCPGCAWPEPKHASAFEFCENGVKAVAFESTGKRVTPDFFRLNTVTHLRQQTDHWLESHGRLTHPMSYNPATDHYEPIAWDDAFSLIGQTLKSLSHPDQAVFYTSGRTSNEAAFLYQLFGRMFGTNNFPDCSNMCHESSGVALGETIGIGKGTVTVEDFQHADAIFVIGQNPGTNHPRMLSELQNAAKRGCKIVSINPLKERGLESFTHPQHATDMLTGRATSISTLYLQPLIAGDLAALTGIMKFVFEAEDEKPGTVLDRVFIKEHTTNFEVFADQVRTTPWDIIETQSGLTRESLRAAADVYLRANAVIICWAMGLTQHKHAVPTIQQTVNLLLLRGHIGRPGAGACPVRGHSNVQGDRTVGITEKPSDAFSKKLGEVFHFTPPRHHGHDVVAAINAMAIGEAKVFIAMGGNFASATPDTEFTTRALERCELTVQISTKLNRSHTAHGKRALILPCLGRTEIDMQGTGPQKVTVEDSMSMVHASRGFNPPASPQLRSEPAIVAGMAMATLPPGGVDWDRLVADYSLIREKIEAVLPTFKDYNKRILEPGGFHLRNSAREREWNTATGRAQFTPATIPDLTLPPGQLRLMTIRSHDQYNTTVYALDDRYRGIRGARRVVFMNPDDITSRRLEDGQLVDLISQYNDGRERIAAEFRVVAYDIPIGCAAAYFPETNVLVSVDSFADKSRTPLSKFVPITVTPSRGNNSSAAGQLTGAGQEGINHPAPR